MKTAKTLQGRATPTAQADESDGPVYFQISYSGLRHVIQNADEWAAAVYIALAAGVDHTNSEYPRACTHGAKAVEARTGLNRKDRVPELVEALFGIDALQRVPEPTNQAVHKATQRVPKLANSTAHMATEPTVMCRVDPERLDDLVAIDQRFLDPYHGSGKRPVRRRVQDDVNSDFMRMMYGLVGRRRGRPFTDAMLLLCGLHLHHDLGRFAGVDPRVAHSRMSPLQDGGPICDIEHVMELFGNEQYRLVMVRETGFPRINAGYAEVLFKGLASPTGEAPADRAAAALDILKTLGLVSTAHVVWTASPLTKSGGTPLVTLYVKGGAAFTDGKHIQHEIDAVVQDTDTIQGSELYPRDAEGSKAAFAGSGVYRYIVHEDLLETSVVLTQLRLKHVADSDSYRFGRDIESMRRDGYRAELRSLNVA